MNPESWPAPLPEAQSPFLLHTAARFRAAQNVRCYLSEGVCRWPAGSTLALEMTFEHVHQVEVDLSGKLNHRQILDLCGLLHSRDGRVYGVSDAFVGDLALDRAP